MVEEGNSRSMGIVKTTSARQGLVVELRRRRQPLRVAKERRWSLAGGSDSAMAERPVPAWDSLASPLKPATKSQPGLFWRRSKLGQCKS